MKTINELSESDAKQLLQDIADLFRVGELARTPLTILENVRNAARRSECLSLIEAHHIVIETDDDGEEYDHSLLHWGEEPEKYIDTYKGAVSA